MVELILAEPLAEVTLIGEMERFSPQFVDAVTRLLDRPTQVVATVGRRGEGFIRAVSTPCQDFF